MRGKLRDKRVTSKHDISRRKFIERRRSTRRDNRPLTQLEQFENEDDELVLDEAEEEAPTPSKK